jgi:hypothetical protein
VACTLTHPVKGAPKLTTYLWSTAALFLFRYALQIGASRFRGSFFCFCDWINEGLNVLRLGQSWRLNVAHW